MDRGARHTGFIRVRASGEPGAARDAQWLMLSVKTRDNESAARALREVIAPEVPVLILQNGVDNIRRLRGILPNPLVPTVVYVATSMSGPGRLRHAGGGELVVGSSAEAPVAHALLESIASTLERAGVGCRVSGNIDGELWSKLMINCALNAVSALGKARYRRMLESPHAVGVMHAAVHEVIAVARASGIRLVLSDPLETIAAVGRAYADASSSTAQDIARGKPTEIDDLNGFIARRGRELGIDVPVNRTLHALVRLREAAEPDGPANGPPAQNS
ncbi:MAG: 2-dehydropantoate 2-reductase [Burkholderiaceae bacterium]